MFIVFFIMGMFIGTTGVLFVTVPIFAPVVHTLGLDLIWFGILVIKMIEIAMITPPVAVNIYIAQGIIKEVPIERAFKAILPFLLCDVFTLALFIAFPKIITILPSMMMGY